MIGLEAYLKDPCGTLSVPYYKAVRMGECIPVRIVHDRDFEGDIALGEKHMRYFRMLHNLECIGYTRAEGYTLRQLEVRDAQKLAALLNVCYSDGAFDQNAALRILQDEHAFLPGQLGAVLPDGTLVGSCLCAYDPVCREGTIEWLQVHPQHRRRGVAAALVNACLSEFKSMAAFVTVSGQCDNESQPAAVYRMCGFTGEDVWHIITK